MNYASGETDMAETTLTQDVIKAQSNDSKAFERLYNISYHSFYMEARKQLANEEDTLDVLQEAYITIYSSLPKLNDPEKFISWGRQIVRRKAIDFIRYKARKTEREYLMPQTSDENYLSIEDLPCKSDKSLEPEAAVDQMFMEEEVQSLIANLPREQRYSLLLWMNQYTCKEIAELTGVSEGTVKSRIRYAKAAIKKAYLR